MPYSKIEPTAPPRNRSGTRPPLAICSVTSLTQIPRWVAPVDKQPSGWLISNQVAGNGFQSFANAANSRPPRIQTLCVDGLDSMVCFDQVPKDLNPSETEVRPSVLTATAARKVGLEFAAFPQVQEFWATPQGHHSRGE